MNCHVAENFNANEKIEYSIRMNIYVELKNEIDTSESMDMGYKICMYIKEHLPNKDDVVFYLHESCMNEDIEDYFELKILCTFYIKSNDCLEQNVIDCFLDSIPNDISNISDNIVPTDELNVYIHECLRN